MSTFCQHESSLRQPAGPLGARRPLPPPLGTNRTRRVPHPVLGRTCGTWGAWWASHLPPVPSRRIEHRLVLVRS